MTEHVQNDQDQSQLSDKEPLFAETTDAWNLWSFTAGKSYWNSLQATSNR